MTLYLLDTNHASLLFRRHQALADRVRASRDAEFFLCRPSIGELWFMVYNSSQVEPNRRDMAVFLSTFRR